MTYSHSIIQLYFWKINRLILPLHHAGNQRMPPLHRAGTRNIDSHMLPRILKRDNKKVNIPMNAPASPICNSYLPKNSRSFLGPIRIFLYKMPGFLRYKLDFVCFLKNSILYFVTKARNPTSIRQMLGFKLFTYYYWGINQKKFCIRPNS